MEIERDRNFGAATSDGGLYEKAKKHRALFTRSGIGRFDDSNDPGVGPRCARRETRSDWSASVPAGHERDSAKKPRVTLKL